MLLTDKTKHATL